MSGETIAEFIRPAEDAIIRARNRVHQRLVVTNNRGRKTLNLRNNCDLASMWFDIRIMHKLARTNSCAINNEVEFCIDVFECFEADIRVDFATGLAKTRGEVIQINRGVGEWGEQ